MKNKIEKKRCFFCGTKFKGNGTVCSQECEKKMWVIYKPKQRR